MTCMKIKKGKRLTDENDIKICRPKTITSVFPNLYDFQNAFPFSAPHNKLSVCFTEVRNEHSHIQYR